MIPLRALSLLQPWLWAICLDHPARKNIENRSWKPPAQTIGQRILLHASAENSRREWEKANPIFWSMLERGAPSHFSPEVTFGAIVALVEVTGFRPPRGPRSEAERATGRDGWHFLEQYGWELGAVLVLERPVWCRGRLGLWTPSQKAYAKLRDQLLAQGEEI